MESKCGTCDSVYKLSKEVLKLIIVTLTVVVKKGMQGSLWRQLEEGRWAGAISANACGPNISWPRALGSQHHHHHLGAARPDQSGPCSGSSVAAQRASWSSPRLLPIPISGFFLRALSCLSGYWVVGCCVVSAGGGVTRPTECWCKKTHADRSLMDAL